MSGPQPSPDQTWAVLSLVIEWIKHAETKAGATLAATGVTGGVLYNLLNEQPYTSVWVDTCAFLCVVLIFVSGICAGLALWPRLRSTEAPTSALYFDHIARAYRDESTSYVHDFRRMTQDSDRLLTEIGEQVWANAHVAHRKYKWAGRALVSLILALAMLAATTIPLAIESI